MSLCTIKIHVFINREFSQQTIAFFLFFLTLMTFDNILSETRKMVSEYMSGFDPSHDMYHVERVTSLGKKQSIPFYIFCY